MMPPPERRPSRRARRPEPVRCTVQSTLCDVRIWTEQQWEALAPGDRPATAAYFAGLGWVVAIPVEHLN